MTGAVTKAAVAAHIRRFWPRRQVVDFEWAVRPISATIPGFVVSRVAPSSETEAWVYVSNGASQVFTGSEQPRLEFLIMSPIDDPIHVETLAMVSNFHADPKYSVHLGKIIQIGRSWMDGSVSDHLLVSLPYPFGPELEVCRYDRGVIRFLWLLPITASEAAFARAHGYEALESRFEDSGIDAIDLHRASVV
jgi:hypothetical protein